MPIFLTLIGILAGAAIWIIRARYIASAAHDLVDAAKDTRLAIRRFSFKRQSNVHPAESIDDPVVAAGALAVAFFELDDFPSREQKNALGRGLEQEFALTRREAEELMVIGHWLSNECKGPDAAITRIGKRLYRLDRGTSFSRLMGVIKETAQAGTGLSQRQSRALDDLRRVFHIT